MVVYVSSPLKRYIKKIGLIQMEWNADDTDQAVWRRLYFIICVNPS